MDVGGVWIAKCIMKRKHLILSAIALIVSITLQSGATARQLSESEQEVEAQLQALIKAQKEEGYELVFPKTLDQLTRGAQAPKTVLLYPTAEYSVVAVCDRSCEDVDLLVRDKDGSEVASDLADYAVAVVNFIPPSEDRYQINVKMNKCSTGNCHFGLGVFVKSETSRQ